MPKALRLALVPEPNEGEALFAFQCKAMKLPRVIEQYSFAVTMGRKFKADFAFPDYKLLVEIKGGIWRKGGGAHSRPGNLVKDIEREQYAAVLCFTLLPFTPDQVFSGHAIEWTQRALSARDWKP